MLTVFLLGSVALSDPPADDLLAGPTIEEEEITSQDMTDRVLKEQGKSNKVGSRKQSRMWMTTLKVIDLTKDQEIEIHKIMAEYQKMNQIFQATSRPCLPCSSRMLLISSPCVAWNILFIF